MSSKQEPSKKVKTVQAKSSQPSSAAGFKLSILESVEGFLGKYEWFVLGFIFAICLYFGLQLFDLRISVLGDDSAYILRASEWIKKGVFPSFQGPLLPLILGRIIAAKGIDLMSLKMVSFLSVMGSVPLLFLALRKRIPYLINFIVLAVYAWNASVLYYASQTFSEALYLFVQALCLFLFLQLIVTKKPVSPLKDSWKYLLYGAGLVLLYMTRSVGISLLIASVAYFIIRLEWKGLGMLLIAFALMYAPFHFYKSQFKEDKGGTSQMDMLMQKDVYDASKGKEDVAGFVKRFIDNSVIYLGKDLPWMMGWSSPPEEQTQEPIKGNGLLTFLIYASFIVCLYGAYKNQEDPILFLVLYCGAFLGIVFFILQTSWDQDRLILTTVPLILISILSSFYLLNQYFFKKFKLNFAVLILGIIFLFANLGLTFKKVEDFAPIKEMNAQGDMLYGYPTEWRNYLEMCQYIGKNFKENQKAVVRKPEMAFIYSNGKDFHGYYRSPEPGTTADSVLNQLNRLGVRYIVQDQIFGTMSNYLQLIGNTYPQRLKLIHQVGQDRPAVLYEIVP